MRHLALFAALSVVCSLSASLAGETELVRLTVEEEAGAARAGEPVTMGVPLPEGKVADAACLGLVDEAGKEIPCQATEVARWLDGKSVKWVHLTWNQSVPAKGKAVVTVVLRDAPAPAVQTDLSAAEANGVVTVQNRFVKFTVKGANFEGFSEAWFDPAGKGDFADANKIIPGGAAAAGSRGSVALAAPKDAVTVADEKFVVPADQIKTFVSTADAEGKAVIEEQTPRRVVVKATGRHLNGEAKMLDYTVRFYAYADSPVVRVQHVFVGAHGQGAGDVEFMSGLYFDVPTALAGGKVTLGTEDAPVSAEGSARIFQDNSDHFTIAAGDRQLAEGKGKSTKPASTGWLDLSKDGRGLAVGIKWFWQMQPKSLSADASGLLRVGLYPAEAEQPLEVYMGMSRTHYLTFVFHDARTTEADLNAIFSGQHRPLRAWAEPRYYCRDTHCFGYSVEADPNLFGDRAEKAKRHDEVMLESVKQTIKKVDFRSRYGGGTDSYGIYSWGDLFHVYWKDYKSSPYQAAPWHYAWEGNYYDHPHAMLMQFIRTGDKTFLERYWPNAVQIGDVHTCNYHGSKPQYVGECRYCPPRNFVSTDDGKTYISNEFNHYKTQSVFAHWYLTGDLRSLEHCRMLTNAAFANHAADSGWAARGVGAQMAGLWNAYELWRDPKYLDRLKGMADRAMNQFSKGKYDKGDSFMWGIANEGLCYYYWVSGDQKALDVLKSGLEKCSAKTKHSNMSLGLAMVYRATGDEQFRDWAWQSLERESVQLGIHEAGLLFRNTHFALFFLSDASKDWKPAGP
jgi:hypothetical protein